MKNRQATIQCLFDATDQLCFQYGDYKRSYALFFSLKNDPPSTPLDSDIIGRLANLNRFWKKWSLAKLQLEISLKINPDNIFSQYVQIRYWTEIEKLEMAKQAYYGIDENEHLGVRELQQKMAAEVALGFYEKAHVTGQLALKQFSEDAGLLYTIGVLENKRGQYKCAIKALQTSLSFRPGHVLASQELKKAEAHLLQQDKESLC